VEEVEDEGTGDTTIVLSFELLNEAILRLSIRH
jgi:hypothetical protein